MNLSSNRQLRVLSVAVVLAIEWAIVVWPLPVNLLHHVSGHWDSFFGVWRLAWVADALTTPGLRLFDAPIFHPHLRTMAYSDAVLVPAIVAAPFRVSGAPPVLIYNLVLIAAFLTSGVAMFLLARTLTRRSEAGLVAATIYMLAPFRLDHLDHLEMQAAAFMPMALWLWHRAVDRQSPAAAAGAAGMGALQWLSAIYYGLLFVPYATAIAAIEWAAVTPENRRRMLSAIVMACGAAAVVIALYSRPYLDSRAETGDRAASVVAQYSATPLSYLGVHPHNTLYGTWLSQFGTAESRLFPGLAALVLAAVGGLAMPWTRRRWAYLAAGLVAFDLSLGTNGLLLPLLRELVLPYRGLRAPGRAGILVLLSVSLFAGWGTAVMVAKARTPLMARSVMVAILVALVIEYRTVPDLWSTPASGEQQHLGLTRGSVAIELPLALPERLDRSADAWYMVARIGAWPSLVNGYSGYYPPDYLALAERLRAFPDDLSLGDIARLGVTVLTVHQRWYGGEFQRIVDALDRRIDVERVGEYKEDSYAVVVYRLPQH